MCYFNSQSKDKITGADQVPINYKLLYSIGFVKKNKHI